jgi:hypothetical protein
LTAKYFKGNKMCRKCDELKARGIVMKPFDMDKATRDAADKMAEMINNSVLKDLMDAADALDAQPVPSSGRIVFDPAGKLLGMRAANPYSHIPNYNPFKRSQKVTEEKAVPPTTSLPVQPLPEALLTDEEEDFLAAVSAQEVPKACDMDSQGCESCQ